MKCPKCGSELSDGTAFCTKCGAALNTNMSNNTNPQMGNPQQGNPQAGPQMGNPQQGNPYGNPQMNAGMPYNGMPQQPYVDPHDHTSEFDAKDISENKVFAMITYLLGTVGIIIALLASRESAYTYFHVRQALKITVSGVLVAIITAVLFWTIIVPIAAGVCSIILVVLKFICFFQVCGGKAKEVPILSSFGFLK